MNAITLWRPRVDTIYCMDLFDLCASLPDASIDMILCDLPYGTTACSWDSVIPMQPMWDAFRRVIKPRGAIALTASQPFTSALVMGWPDGFRYAWVWEKSLATGYLNANKVPMKAHEDIAVFYKESGCYNPQMTEGKPYRATRGAAGGHIRDKTVGGHITLNTGARYPRSVIKIDSEQKTVHPTQKPVALFEYLIKTYTQPGEVVLDPCVGSGTTAVAAHKTGRHYICGDKLPEYADMARQRVQDTDPYQPTQVDDDVTQLSLFANTESHQEGA